MSTSLSIGLCNRILWSVDTDLAAYVAARRAELGLTQQELADRSGLKRDVIAGIETRKSKLPEPETRRKLARGLGVTHERLLIAAGQLLPEEASRVTEPRRFSPDSPYEAVLDILNRMDEREAQALAEAGDILISLRRPQSVANPETERLPVLQ